MLQKIMSNQPRGGERGQLLRLEKFIPEEKLAAVLFGPAAQAEPANLFTLFDCPPLGAAAQRPRYAAGTIRSVLPAEAFASGFPKPMRGLTKHISTEYPGISLWRRRRIYFADVRRINVFTNM